MNLFQAFILGIVQGLTEFLPVSSSAHLVLTPFFLGWKIPTEQVFPFDVLVQLGTLAAVILYFWKDLVSIVRAVIAGLTGGKPFETHEARLGWYLVLATVPASLLGLLIKAQVESAFNSPAATAIFLFGTAALLVAAEKIGKRQRMLNEMGWKDAFWIGCFQALSLFPGLSRSGSTIAGGMSRHFQRAEAGRFSFLMSIPVMLGAGLLSILDLLEFPGLGNFLPVLLVGFLTAAVVGYLSIGWLLSFLNRQSLKPFAVYCVSIAVLTLLKIYVL